MAVTFEFSKKVSIAEREWRVKLVNLAEPQFTQL